MNFRKVNNLTGWAVFLVAMLTYMLTREARGSLWDCGEFVACAYKLGLPHPPGAPMFTLLGRFFIILFGDDPMTAANAVNFMSAAANAATILFLFWTITHFARKIFVSKGEQLEGQQIFTVMAAGIVGALAYTFSDSFWYSGVEGEVYALSSFFTALVFWAMLKWEHADEQAGTDEAARARSDRWIIYLFFMMGLSIGVHLLNLLTIPAIVMIYYYRRYPPTLKGSVIAFLIGCVIVGIVQVVVIQYSMKAAGLFDVFFVNSMGLPFFSGFAVYFVALAALVVWALSFTEKNISKGKLTVWFILFLLLSLLPFVMSSGAGWKFMKFILVAGIATAVGYLLKPGALKILKLSLWCYAFIMLGYFMYFTALIRSNANPVIDMNNVDNPINLVYYLSREQYGSAPLVYGPHFSAQIERDENGDPYIYGEMKYVKGKDRYIEIGREKEIRYRREDMRLFPRIWDSSNEQRHAQFYADWLGIGRSTDPQTGRERYDPPTFSQNVEWFFTYQMGFMYWRYFMWNFAGKQNDIQGDGNKRDGNWLTGISLIDNARLGDQAKIPDSIKTNKAHNTLYLLPFILGVIGFVYQFIKNRKDWIVSMLLFFFTGLAIVLYLNQPGNQPRERDYAYAGSFYAFAIWIGLAVVAFVRLAREKQDKLNFQNVLVYGSGLTFLVTLLSCLPGHSVGGVFAACIYASILYALVAAGVTYLVRAVSGNGQNSPVLNLATSLLCLAVPLLMAQQEWDDHNRSTKTLAPDLARDYLESCAPNAILFTYGDNDTYPLWYAQEVEGVRPDIRIINNSLLGIDWYINQLRRKVNQADSVDVIWSPEQIEGHNREYLFIQEDPRFANSYPDLYRVMKEVLGKPYLDPETKRDVGQDIMPIRKFTLPVDVDLVRRNGTVSPTDSVLSEIRFELPAGQNAIQRNDLMVLNIVAANKWQRPIYFTSPYGVSGFDGYLRKDGLAYRLVPVTSTNMAANWMINTFSKDNNLSAIGQNLLNKFVFDSKKGTYFDEENRRHILNIRNTYAEAAGNLADAGRKDEALKLLERCESLIHKEDMPYAMVSRGNQHNINSLAYLEACYKAGNLKLAGEVRAALKKDLEQQAAYYEYLRQNKEPFFSAFDGREGEAARNAYFLSLLDALEQRYNPNAIKPAVNNSSEHSSSLELPGIDSNNK